MTVPPQQVGEVPLAHIESVGQGNPVLLLHGWGSSAELMMPVARKLADGNRCIVVDFPGHGSTPPPPVGWGPGEFVDWTVALMDRLNIEKADVIGHSHGGRIAIGLAASHPERVGKLVLAASAGLRSTKTLPSRFRTRVFKAGRRLSNSRLTPAPGRKKLQAWAERQGSPDYRAASGVMRDTLVRLVNADARALLPQIASPVLLVWGDLDQETPLAGAKEMEALIPDAGLVVLDNGGHFAYAEQLDRFCTIVSAFLDPVK